ncbi:MAG: MarR family transcriptional regulator [Anaerolineae bacterium]|jgi:DNA-binding MarR family transcriptional regulator|nr:MarR family transcriptional regulator [Anaerolineae bacterium]
MKLHELTPIDFMIWRVGHHHHQLVSSRLENLGLYRGQPRLLASLYEQDGQTHGELASQLNVQPATITKMVQRMEQKGFIIRRADLKDQRISRVFLTPKGTEIHNQVIQMFVQVQADQVEGFSEEEKASLMLLLRRLNENIEKHLPNHCS